MESEYKAILKSVGYDVECLGSYFFFDLVRDVQLLLKEGKDDQEILQILPRYYLEYYHFYYELGKKRYLQELDFFCNSRVVTEKNMDKNQEIMGMIPNMNLENSILFFAKYFNSQEKDFEASNVYIKKNSSME